MVEINTLKDRVGILENEKNKLNDEFEKFRDNESVDGYFKRLQMRSLGDAKSVENIRNEIL